MAEPKWISYQATLDIQRDQIDEFGGSHGIRDEGLLQSALGRPQNLYHYGDPEPDLITLAASYAYGIAKNHPFVDGNKRAAFVVCSAFLDTNGIKLIADAEDVYKTVEGLAADKVSEQDFAKWLEDHRQFSS